MINLLASVYPSVCLSVCLKRLFDVLLHIITKVWLSIDSQKMKCICRKYWKYWWVLIIKYILHEAKVIMGLITEFVWPVVSAEVLSIDHFNTCVWWLATPNPVEFPDPLQNIQLLELANFSDGGQLFSVFDQNTYCITLNFREHFIFAQIREPAKFAKI